MASTARCRVILVAIGMGVASAAWCASPSQPVTSISISNILRIPVIDGVAISPDGEKVAYTTLARDPGVGHAERKLWLVYTSGSSRPRLLAVALDPKSNDLQWSADSKRIAYLVANHKGNDLVVQNVLSGRRLNALIGREIQAFRWSPVRQEIAVVQAAAPGATKRGELEVVGEGADGTSDLYTIDASTLHTNRITNGQAPSGFAWAPSGDEIVYSARGNLWLMLRQGGRPRSLVKRAARDQLPEWSPDGTRIAFVSQSGPGGPAVLSVVTIADGQIKDNIGDIDFGFGGYPPRCLRWDSSGTALYVPVFRNMTQHLFRVDLKTSKVTAITDGQRVLQNFSFAVSKPLVAFLMTDPVTPNQLQVADLRSFAPRVLATQGRAAEQGVGTIEAVKWSSADDVVISGLLLKPPGYDSRRQYPLAVVMEGTYGAYDLSFTTRDSADSPSTVFPFQPRLLAAAGFVVLLPNPRGSWGFGEQFWKLGKHDYALGPYNDIVSGVDSVANRGIADPNRVAILGIGFDGYRTAFAITRTDRFKAAVIIEPLTTDLLSAYGQGDAWIRGVLTMRMGGTPWERMQAYFDASPVASTRRITTPTLIVNLTDPPWTGGQAAELQAQLQSFGAPTRRLIYHQSQTDVTFTKLQAFALLTQECIDWVLKATSQSPESPPAK